MPQEVARKLVYPTRSRGELLYITINSNRTTDVVDIAQHFDQVPFLNEYAIVLSETMLNPEKAKEAGITMTYFDPTISKGTSLYKEFERKLDDIMFFVEWQYNRRVRQPELD